MNPFLSSVMAVAATVAIAGCAGDTDPGTTAAIGQVRALYVERSPGVFIDHRMPVDSLDNARWAAVALRQPLPDGGSFATARIDPDTAVEVGDTVELELGPQPARVTAVLVKRSQRAAAPLNLKGPRWAS
ncbi:MAG: hypothetical protein KIS79_00125 [Burkholderiales bacterium]|nr:hypothetical protein [Burkholderiales bacterium]